MNQLVPCPECSRHVRKNETTCPFCGQALALAHLPAPAVPRRRLGRAATFAFGASVVGATALVACSDDDDGGAPVPVYGAPAAGAPAAGSANGGSANGGSANGGTANGGSSSEVDGGGAGVPGSDDGPAEAGAGGQAGSPPVSGVGGEARAVYGAPPGADG